MTLRLFELMAPHVASAPERDAIVMGEDRCSYGELDRRARALARAFADAGVRRGDRVGLFLPKGPDAIAAMLAAMRAGGCYVPMDPSSPPARLQRIVDSCEPRLVVASDAARAGLERLRFAAGTTLGWLGEGPAPEGSRPAFDRAAYDGPSDPPLDAGARSDEPAHILFTSGSTGQPKGVVITHDNVVAFVRWAVREFGTEPGERVSGHSPLFFDLSTYDIYGAFHAGATLYPVPPQLNLLPHKLAQFVRDNGLTQWFSVPSILNYMAKFDVVAHGDFPALRRLHWCGEVFPTPALRYWMQRLPHVRFTNLYGPTEATIASSFYTVPSCPADDRDEIPIGRACEGESLLVLDENLEPVAPGQTGDLYIAGVGLSPGYWRAPELTAAAFVEREGERIYKTGDLARVDEHGLVYYLGRADSQIKSRGYRIELGEIETALHAIAELREAAVVAIPTGGFEGSAICCAYAARSGSTVTPAALRARLKEAIPGYMIPSHWLAFDALPKTPNGKIDRPALRERFQQEVSA